MRYDRPLTKADFPEAYLMADRRKDHVVIDGMEVTAENVWNWDGDRNELVEKLVAHFKGDFVPFEEVSDEDLEKNCLDLRKRDASEECLGADGRVKNTSTLCLVVCRRFCADSFYSTRVNGTASIKDVFASEELLRKVLMNRLGWYTTSEKKDGVSIERPYLFDISRKMVVQGAHSSMVSANVSNFRPLVAKLLMSKYCEGGRVLDLSSGWCSRLLAAWSLGKEYYGIDPMTADDNRKLAEFILSNPKLSDNTVKLSNFVKGVSEDSASYKDFPEVDYVIACPPYFKLEEYACEGNSTDSYSDYGEWLEKYWKRTVKNAVSKLRTGGKFTLIMVERWGRYELLKDMTDIMASAGLSKFDELSYKTTRSHLTDKRKTGKTDKATEKIVTFEKKGRC